MINYKFQINYKIKIKQKNVGMFFCNYNSIVTKVPLKDLAHMLCLQLSHFANYIKEVSPLAFSY
jgi:hypothetical protein